MKINIKATKIDLTDPIRAYAEEKISALEKYFEKLDIVKIELERKTEKKTGLIFRAEVTIDVPHGIFRAESSAADLYAAIDTVVPKLVSQMEKFKHRRDSRARAGQRRVKEGY